MTYESREGVDYIVDLYALAGTEREAAEADIKTALNERALEYHPDRLQGTAPEFQEKAERIAKLLNRARGILLDPVKRTEYDEILNAWDGPLSTDGTPVITMDRLQEPKFQSMRAEEVEAAFTEQVTQIAAMTGYNPNRLAFIERMVEQAGDNVSDELRVEYEEALLQKDRALAIEEAERSKILGMPDIQDQNYVASLDYGEETKQKLETARIQKREDLKKLALGSVSTKLALLAGASVSNPNEVTSQTGASLELPVYYDQQSARVQEIANERGDIAEKRLRNFEPTYPNAELQTEIKDKLIIGIATSKGYMWVGIKLSIEDEGAEFQDMSKAVKARLDKGDYQPFITLGYNVMLVNLMENIDIQDLLGVAIGKYVDKYKTEQSDDSSGAS